LSAEDRLAELKRRLLEISDLGAASSVLSWDQATYMPKEGAAARGRQSATLQRLVAAAGSDRVALCRARQKLYFMWKGREGQASG